MKSIYYEIQQQSGHWMRIGSAPQQGTSDQVISIRLKEYVKRSPVKKARCVDDSGRVLDIHME